MSNEKIPPKYDSGMIGYYSSQLEQVDWDSKYVGVKFFSDGGNTKQFSINKLSGRLIIDKLLDVLTKELKDE